MESLEDTSEQNSIWCVVANIRKEHPFGPGGLETKVGTKSFRGGTKVYITGCYAGVGESVICVGLHRHSRKFFACVVHVKYLENFRPKVLYHPRVLKIIEGDRNCFIKTQEQAETWAVNFVEWQKTWKER